MSIKCQNIQEKNEKVNQSTTHTGIKPGSSKRGLHGGLEGPFDFPMIKIFYPNCFLCYMSGVQLVNSNEFTSSPLSFFFESDQMFHLVELSL